MTRKAIGRMAGRLGLATALALGSQFALAADSPPAEGATYPAWQAPQAASGAPNIILIMLDDVGFGAASGFGGLVSTPVFDQLARDGLRFNRFHTTAVCSSTRAALLTGRNHHRVGFGDVSGSEKPYPGYDGIWRKSGTLVPRILRDNGYSTSAIGKWHNTPNWQASPVGPFENWPTSLGFEYFYGFMGGEADQWQPIVHRNTHPMSVAPENYNFNTDIANDAISWLHTHQALAPAKPYFLYYSPGATHAPHHVGQEWIDKYKGHFDKGWDALRATIFANQKKIGVVPKDAKLTERPDELPAWDSLPDKEKTLLARQMEVYAGFLEQTDHEIGRVIEAARKGPGGDNLLVIYIMGDNGASAEGGMHGSDRNLFDMITRRGPGVDVQLSRLDELGSDKADNHFGSAWAWFTDTPFQWTKQIASHLGGTRNPMVVSWPGHAGKPGDVRTLWTHVIDIAPTLYELAGIAPPDIVDGVEQMGFDGRSFATALKKPVPEPSRTQYFEMLANRGIYSDGWMAVARHGTPWVLDAAPRPLEEDRWELYHIEKDFTQSTDLAARHPDKLASLKALYEEEAARNDAPSLTDKTLDHGLMNAQPSLAHGRSEFVFTSDMPPVQSLYGLPMLFGPHRIDADIRPANDRANGIIVANGARDGGFVLYLKDGHLIYENNMADIRYDRIRSAVPVPAGQSRVSFTLEKGVDGVQQGRIFINGKEAGSAPVPQIFMPSYLGALCISRSCGTPVSKGYTGRFPFEGTVEQVRIRR